MIITDFLIVAKNKPANLQGGHLEEVIRSMLPLIQSDVLLSNRLFTLICRTTPKLLLDEHEIRQLLLNLVRNAFEATSAKNLIIIRLFTDRQYTILSVTNPGEKIHSQVLEKIGTPFFTTKEAGTGLGLATCYRIAEKHKATMDILDTTTETTIQVKFHNP